MKRLTQFLLSLSVSVLILWALLYQFDVQQTLVFVREARPDFLLFGVTLMVLAYLLRGARWRIWERSLSYRDSLRLVLIGFMGNNILPARLGELLRAHCAAFQTGEERRRTATLGSIAAERVLDGMVLASFSLVSIAVVTIDRRLEWALFVVSFGFASLGASLILSIRHHFQVRSFIAAGHQRFPGHLTSFAREKIEQFLDGLLPVGTGARLSSALAATTLIWALEVGFCYFIGAAVWDGMTVQVALLLLVVVNFASLVPLTMGGIGTIEAVAPVFLISVGIAPSAALAIVLLQHASQYFFTTFTGGMLYVGGGFYRLPIARPSVRAGRRASSAATLERVGAADSKILEETRSSLGQFGASLKPAPRDEVQLSIVIPAYNEQSRLPRTVLETIRWCTMRKLEFEVIIADDGSRDETLALARLFEDSDARIRALACPHMGKGATVRLGVLNAKGRTIMFMDADGATPLDEIPKLLAAIEGGHDVAIGSRIAQRSAEVVVKARLHRRIIGRAFALFVNLFAIGGVGDTQCGFKMFRRAAAEAVFSRQRLVGFAFDVELLFIADGLKLSVAEIPVNWVEQPGSKVNLVTDSIKMLWDISRIRWLHRDLRWGPEREVRPAT